MSEKLCIFGEVLFDVFPDGKRVLGGAPFNVAWHLQAFSQAPYFISRVGKRHDGITIRKTMLEWGMNTLGLQTDDNLPTGIVNVSFNEGEPEYDIVHPSAYDNIEIVEQLDSCEFIYHGSLALRDQASAKALQHLLALHACTVFVDINLRTPWWNKEETLALMKNANWVKLNIDELNLLAPAEQNNGQHTQQRLAELVSHFDLQGVILTNGEKGAEIFTDRLQYERITPTKTAEVVDTVGAGDAFTSIMIMGLRNDWDLKLTLERAQEFASSIVQQRGATVSDKLFYQQFKSKWNID